MTLSECLANLPSPVLRSVVGTSVGDAFGERFFVDEDRARTAIAARELPPPPWSFTDDTVMTVAVAAVLAETGGVDASLLARRLGALYVADPSRGYGPAAHRILRAFAGGAAWDAVARAAFDGMGSMGNGAAMRSAPIGAFFSADVAAAVEHAGRAAGVTHAHPDGQAGAIAVAVAAAVVVASESAIAGDELLRAVLEHTPPSATRDGIERGLTVPLHLSPRTAAGVLGNGTGLCAHDTVPFALWAAARHLDDYVAAVWTTVEALGDRDTLCAIVGGIVAAGAPSVGVPESWIRAREPLRVLDGS